METQLTRRETISVLGAPLFAAPFAAKGGSRPTPCLFSKHLPDLNYEQLGRTLKQLGFSAVDLTVRPKGHVLPDRVEQDLPRAVATLRDAGIEVAMITTALNSATEPATQPILSTAGKLAIHFYKPGYYAYAKDFSNIEERVREVRGQMKGLTELGRTHGVQAGFHNHSGNNVGAALWDEWEVLRDLDPQWAGSYFDPCHAVAEGGVAGWNIGLHLLAPRIKMMAVKDFYWEKSGGKWRMKMCPLGEGMVPWDSVFKTLAAVGFRGPISLHLEYDLPADPLPAIARDFAFLQARVREAWGG